MGDLRDEPEGAESERAGADGDAATPVAPVASGRRVGAVLRVDQTGRTVLLDPPAGGAADAADAAGAAPPLEEVRCQVRGTLARALRQDGRERVAVGDRVEVSFERDGGGVIEALLPRRSVLVRRAAGEAAREQVTAANVDRIVVVVAAREPGWKPGFVDRVLCAAERAGLPASLVINKVDLLDDAERAALEEEFAPYGAIDVPVLLTSVSTGEGLDALREHLAGHVSVVAGPSGVGKSSLLNQVEPDLGLRVRAVSASTSKGRHTTTAVTMVPMRLGGAVIDTPGVRAFGFYDLEPRELGWLFKDLRPFAYHGGDHDQPRCRFADCQHRGEPGCEVLRAVEAGTLSASRHESYLRILESLEQERPTGRASSPR